MPKRITPAVKGTDIESIDKKYDAHVRLEEGGGEWLILVDVFDSAIRCANIAHVDSDAFPTSSSGAKEATEYLRGYGFDVRIVSPGSVK